MIRLSTGLWLALAAVLGYGLFHLKHEVKALEDELFRLDRAVLAELEAIHVLRAEWSYVNQPQRLQELAGRHLDLRPMRPTQLGRAADLPARPPEDAPPSAGRESR
ncbi:MAG: cell division protein FtsL [Pseudomonadota bacterium]